MQKTSKVPKKNVLKFFFHKTPKDIKKIEGSNSEALDGAALKEYLSSEPNFTETKRVERLYENTNDLVIQVGDLNKGKNKGSKEGDPDKENSQNTKTKPMVLPKPKKGQS